MCFEYTEQFFKEILSYTDATLNSQWGIAAIGSFFGAVGGYVMVWLTNHRSEIFSKVSHIKMAIALSHSLLNIFYSLKKQHTKSLCEQYKKDRAKFIAIKTGAARKPGVVTVPFNFQSLSFPYVDFGLINSKLFDKTDISGRAFALANALIRCVYELKSQFGYRHAVINEMNKISDESGLDAHDRACLYYGVPLETKLGGFVYKNYSDAMQAIENFNDDCIWFSKELTQELIEFGKETANKLIISRPKVGSIDYSDLDAELMPADENYKDWREKYTKA